MNRTALLELLGRHAHDARRLVLSLEQLAQEPGARPHAALLQLLTGLRFEESDARRHWAAIAERQVELARLLARDPGVRVAVLDHFCHPVATLREPRLIDLELAEEEPFDPTRGLATDRSFRAAVEREVRRARRHGERTAIVLFDLDDFTTLNRRAGRATGDRLIDEAALLLTNRIRSTDIAASPGEDELAVVLPSTDRPGAVVLAERYRREVEAFFSSRDACGHPAGLTVSAGVAACPEDATDADRLVSCAAQALYVAKATGKNAVATFRGEA